MSVLTINTLTARPAVLVIFALTYLGILEEAQTIVSDVLAASLQQLASPSEPKLKEKP